MNYTLDETFELSGYTATITADEDLSRKINDNFLMIVRDILSNDQLTIRRGDLFAYGTTVTDGDPETWATQSCLKNDGIYINFNGNKLIYKQVLPCRNITTHKNIGYNSSEIKIFFDQDQEQDIDFHSKVLPFFQRSLPFKNPDNIIDEPILEDTSARPDYDFDYRHLSEESTLSGFSSNIKYNSVGDLYVNNKEGHIKKYEEGNLVSRTPNLTPEYCSDISAFYITTDQIGAIKPMDDDYGEISTIKSTIWNEITDEESKIPYERLVQSASTTLSFDNYETDVIYNVYRQFIKDDHFQNQYRKNVLKFGLEFENNGIELVEIQRLNIVVTKNGDKVHIKIENPNLTLPNGEDHPLKDSKIYFEFQYGYYTGSVITYETKTISATQVGNVVEFDYDVDIDCGYGIYVTAWLSDAVKGYNPQSVEQATKRIVGPYDVPGTTSKEPYKPITISLVGARKYVYTGQTTLTYEQALALYEDSVPAKDEFTNKLTLNNTIWDDHHQTNTIQKGIMKFKVENLNYGPEWNTNFHSIVDSYSRTGVQRPIIITEDLDNKIYWNSTEAYFYVYNIDCRIFTSENEYIIVDNLLDTSISTEGESPCIGAWGNTQSTSQTWILNETHQSHEQPPEPDPKDIFLYCCEEDNLTDPCYEYEGPWSWQAETTTRDHVLDVYYDSQGNIRTDVSQFGETRFVIKDPNTNESGEGYSWTPRSMSNQLRIQVYFNNQPVIDINDTLENLNNVGVPYDQGVVKVSPIYVNRNNMHNQSFNYVNDGVIGFSVYDITPGTVMVRVTMTYADERFGTRMAEDSIKWTMMKFIPDDWEFFLDYVLFTKSKLYLNGAYVGVKSVFCTAVKADNQAYIDSTVYIDGTGDWDGYYLDLNNVNNGGRFADVATDGIGNDAIIEGAPGTDIKYYDFVDGNNAARLYYNPKAHAKFVFTTEGKNRTKVTNNAYIGSNLPTVAAQSKDLPKLTVDYKGGDNVNIGNNQTLELNAHGGVADYGAFNSSNNATLILQPGEYHFTSFTTASPFTLIIPEFQNGEWVRICVRDRCDISNNFNLMNYNRDMMSFMLYTDYADNGSGPYAIDIAAQTSDYNYGVLVAPYGTVNLTSQITWNGAIWSKNLLMQNGAKFISQH